jgi:hypothetical protein
MSVAALAVAIVLVSAGWRGPAVAAPFRAAEMVDLGLHVEVAERVRSGLYGAPPRPGFYAGPHTNPVMGRPVHPNRHLGPSPGAVQVSPPRGPGAPGGALRGWGGVGVPIR